jgi:hypothetical protein
MDAERRSEVTDAALDGELRAMLGVEPSPTFVPRVRARIADEPSRSWWWFGAWTLIGSAVAVAAIAIVAVSLDRPVSVTQPPAPLDARGLAGLRVPHVVSGFRRTVDVHAASRTARRDTVAPHEQVTQALAEPEILVDPREAAAMRALIFGTRDGRIDLAPMVNASTPSVMELPPVEAIDIPALTIDPIAPGTGEQGVPQ